MPLDIDDVIARAHLPERTVPVCLRGDLVADWEVLERELKAAQESTDDDSLAGNSAVRDLAARMADLGKEIAASEVSFRFRGLSSKGYSDLCAEHRATEGDEEVLDGLNFQTFPHALVAACSVDPPMTVEKARELKDRFSDTQWDDLVQAALAVNRSRVSIPFSLSASAILASTEPSSKRPALGASPEAGSSDESLFEPPSTPTTKKAG